MKDCKNIAQKLMKKVVDHTLSNDANSTTCIVVHQPKAPASLKKFSKFSDAE